MEVHGIPWSFMEFHGTPWKFHGVSMECPWSSMELHGLSIEFHSVPWNSMELHELFMAFHGIPLTYLFTFNCITKFARVPHQQRKKGINIFQYYFQSTIMEYYIIYYIISANFVFSGKGVTS